MYSEYNDYELVAMAREGSEEAINIIYQKYKPIIVSKSKHSIVLASHHGIEISDIMQEGYIGLEEAIKSFSEADNTSFYTFAVLCINRQIINYLRKLNCTKDKVLNDAVVIDETLEKTMKDGFDTEFSFMSNEIMEDIENNLTEFERDVFKYRVEGYSFEEIANTLNDSVSAAGESGKIHFSPVGASNVIFGGGSGSNDEVTEYITVKTGIFAYRHKACSIC